MQDAPFFTVKLGIKVLPAVLGFHNGVNGARLVGFEQLGSRDDFKTATFEQRLLAAGVLELPNKDRKGDEGCGAGAASDDDGADAPRSSIRHGFHSRQQRDEDDESSDFDD